MVHLTHLDLERKQGTAHARNSGGWGMRICYYPSTLVVVWMCNSEWLFIQPAEKKLTSATTTFT